MSDGFVYRIIEETSQGSYNPSGEWRELRHTTATLSATPENSKISGITNHCGYSDVYVGFEPVSGGVGIEFVKEDVEFLINLMTGMSKISNKYQLANIGLRTVTIEQYDPENNVTYLYSDVSVDTMSFQFNFGQLISVAVDFAGGFSTRLEGSRPSDSGTFTRSGDEPKLGYHGSVDIYYQNNLITDLCTNSATLTVTNNTNIVNDINDNYGSPLSKGLCSPSGQMTVYNSNGAFQLLARSFSNDSVNLKFIIDTGTGGLVTFDIPVTYLEGEIPSDSGKDTDMMVDIQFQGIGDDQTGEIMSFEFID